MELPDLPQELLEKYRERLSFKDMATYEEFGELMTQTDEDLTDEEKSALATKIMNKIHPALRVLQRMAYKAFTDPDVPEEIVIVMIEQLTKIAVAAGGTSFYDFAITDDMEEQMKGGDSN